MKSGSGRAHITINQILPSWLYKKNEWWCDWIMPPAD